MYHDEVEILFEDTLCVEYLKFLRRESGTLMFSILATVIFWDDMMQSFPFIAIQSAKTAMTRQVLLLNSFIRML